MEQRGVSTQQIPQEEIKRFCANCQILEVVRMQPIHKELTSPNYGDLVYEFQDEESVAPWYVATRAVELFRTKHGRYPGEGKTEDQLENEFKLLKQECDELMKEAFPDDPIEMNNKYLKELVRFSDSKLHTVGAYLGGVAS